MNDGIEWRFGNTGYQDEDALDTGDVETFKKEFPLYYILQLEKFKSLIL